MDDSRSKNSPKGKPELSEINPNRVLYIHPHSLFTKSIKIFDLTPHMTETYPSESFNKQAVDIAKNTSLGSLFLLSRKGVFDRTFQMTEPPAQDIIAEWKFPYFRHIPSELTFPKDSSHCSHPLAMKSLGWGDKENFIQDSVEYIWKHDRSGKLSYKRFKLVKNYRERRLLVAKYWEPFSWNKGGTLIIDETEIDVVVAALTCCVMLMKKRQKNAERS